MTRRLLAFALLLSGCAPSATPYDPAADSSMAIRLISDPGSLDPHSGGNAASAMAAMFSYDRVLANVDGEIRPQIAEAWSATPNAVHLRIRRDIVCDDGHHLTASDLAANFRRMVDPRHGAPIAAGVFGSTRITVTADDAARTVDVAMAAPNSDVLYGLARVAVVCPAGLADLDRLGQHPSGTGPYRLVSAIPGERYVYRRRAGYQWGPGGLAQAAPGAPDTVVLKVIENEFTAANMLSAGELDIARIIGPDRLRLERDPRLVRHLVTPSLFSLFFNQHDGRIGQDVAVRRALAAALDRRLVALAAAGPAARVANSFQAPEAPCYAASDASAIPSYDLARAARALDRAGYRLVDGARRDRTGKALTLRVILPADFDLAVDVLVGAWEALGIHAEVLSESEAQMTSTTFSGGDWDVVMVNGDATISGRNAVFFMGATPPNGLNFTFSRDQIYAALVERARRTPMPGACALWKTLNRHLLESAALVPILFGEFAWFGRDAEFKPVFNDQSLLYPTSLRRIR